MKYMSKFFPTLAAAEEFQQQHGGALYKYHAKVKKGGGLNRYTVEAVMRGMTHAEMEALPYCVAWNER